MSDTKLEIRDLCREFRRGNRIFKAVNDVNLTVNKGSFVSITGQSGSGKSTLLNLITGLLLPTGGDILLDGKSIISPSDEEASLLRNTVIGYIPQGQSLLHNLSVIDNIRLPFYLKKRQGDPDKRAMELCCRLGIGDLTDSYPADLSGGEMKRVSIARALINEPDILIADEPTGDLDKANTGEIVSLFKKMKDAGTTVIMVTHDLGIVKYTDENYIMNKGKLIKEGTIALTA